MYTIRMHGVRGPRSGKGRLANTVTMCLYLVPEGITDHSSEESSEENFSIVSLSCRSLHSSSTSLAHSLTSPVLLERTASSFLLGNDSKTAINSFLAPVAIVAMWVFHAHASPEDREKKFYCVANPLSPLLSMVCR